MREVVVVSQCRKKSLVRSRRILDRYFFRVGERTWRGRASNACLERVAGELREFATKATAVAIHEVKESRRVMTPLIVVGRRSAFLENGTVPTSSSPSSHPDAQAPGLLAHRSILALAALFHDLGKATNFFQDKLQRSLHGDPEELGFQDPVRHEVFSAFAWDFLCSGKNDRELVRSLECLTPEALDAAAEYAASECRELFERSCEQDRGAPLSLSFLDNPESLGFAVGSLILTHHRLSNASETFTSMLADQYVNTGYAGDRSFSAFSVSTRATPYWHDAWFYKSVRGALRDLPTSAINTDTLHHLGRTALIIADQRGSFEQSPGEADGVHLANTIRGLERCAGDDLITHVKKVHRNVYRSFNALYRDAHRYPALNESTLPPDLVAPQNDAPSRFRWQADAAQAAREVASSSEGGFFACLMAGTGTGKTRGAPTILTAAALGDADPKRRYVRFNLGLGLRTLATQSADEYVEALDLPSHAVACLVGTPPIDFTADQGLESGTENLDAKSDGFDIEPASSLVTIPEEGDESETAWLNSLSLDLDRSLPSFISDFVEIQGRSGDKLEKLLSTEVICATVDHLAAVTGPVKSGHVGAAIRVLTSDLILDEIDQYGEEDLAALARLAYLVGLSGRRLIIMSATVTKRITKTLFDSYRTGWKEYARHQGKPGHVHTLVTGDAPGSSFAQTRCRSVGRLYDKCQQATSKFLNDAEPLRTGSVLPLCETWQQVVTQISQQCSNMHDLHGSEIDEFRVSFGFVKATRVKHTTAIAEQIALEDPRRLRKVICLHSRFPRAARSWIEHELKRPLTRKGSDPHAGLEEFCSSHGLFEQARQAGVRDIEIVLVCSPVIETGNDLDFDYAIIDPVDMRSIVQAAGRVLRHRTAKPHEHANVLILGRPLVDMDSGGLKFPGFETDTSRRETLVVPVHRSELDMDDVTMPSLVDGQLDVFDRIDARLVIAPSTDTPLRRATETLQDRFFAGRYSIENYLTRPLNKLSTGYHRRRKFRRSTTRNVEVALSGTAIDNLHWMIDQYPNTRLSNPQDFPFMEEGAAARHLLWADPLREALRLKLQPTHQAPPPEFRRLSAVAIPVYDEDAPLPRLSYCPALGVMMGALAEKNEPFGVSR